MHDPRNIKIASEYVFEDEKIESLVETDDKAFLFSKDKNLLVIPTYSLASGE